MSWPGSALKRNPTTATTATTASTAAATAATTTTTTSARSRRSTSALHPLQETSASSLTTCYTLARKPAIGGSSLGATPMSTHRGRASR